MKRILQILHSSKIQLILSILVLLGSFIVNSLQGTFGFFLPCAVFVFFIVIIILIYYIVSLPLLDKLSATQNVNNSYTLEQIINYESTGDIKEIWIISDLKMATDMQTFGNVIKKNIARGVKYKFYIKNNNIIKEKAKKILTIDKKAGKYISFYCFDSEPAFLDGNTDYDLFFENSPMNNKGYIGVTINNNRNYILISQELFLNLKIFLEQIEPTDIS